MRKISEPNLTLCPACGKETFAKQVSAPSFQLNGTGWYATDFKNSGSKSAGKSGDKAEKSAESASSATAAGCATGCACH